MFVKSTDADAPMPTRHSAKKSSQQPTSFALMSLHEKAYRANS